MDQSAWQKSTGSRRTASAASSGKSSGASKPTRQHFAVCIKNAGHEASLQVGKVYRVARPIPGDRGSELRVIDEEGEDYLYPANRFVLLQLPLKAQKALGRTSSR